VSCSNIIEIASDPVLRAILHPSVLCPDLRIEAALRERFSASVFARGEAVGASEARGLWGSLRGGNRLDGQIWLVAGASPDVCTNGEGAAGCRQ
jgi:hypothetical protein